MSRACATCHSPNRAEIEAQIVSGIGLSAIERDFPITRDALRRHRENHMSPTLIAVKNEHARQSNLAATAADRVASLLGKLEDLVERTHEERRESMLLAASRELRSAIELSAKLDGSLRPENQTTVQVLNLSTSPEWIDVRSRILAALAPYPEARIAVAEALRGGTPDVTPQLTTIGVATPQPAASHLTSGAEADDEVAR